VSQSPSGLFVTDGPRQTALTGAGAPTPLGVAAHVTAAVAEASAGPPTAPDDDLDDIPF
jgi:hypothetical protein